MGLLRLLIIALIFWIVFGAIKEWLGAAQQRARQSSPRPTAAKSERMVKCARCGLHVPESEALRAAGRFYCSAAHRDARDRHG